MEFNTTFPSVLSSPTYSNDSTSMEPYQRPFDETAVRVYGFFTFVLLTVGVMLNTITVAVILKYKKLRNLFVYFICSLCVSDLLSALISPLFWYRRTLGFDHWMLPGFFCKFYWAADLMTSFATAMHIVAFGIFRLISIRHPHFFATISNKIGVFVSTAEDDFFYILGGISFHRLGPQCFGSAQYFVATRLVLLSILKVCVIAIWIISLGCGFVPYCIWFGARERDRYSSSPDARWPACTINMEWYDQYTAFQKIAFSLFLYVPLVLVVIISVLTCLQVYATTHSAVGTRMDRQIRKEKQAVLQLTLIVISFLFGYIPFTAYEFWSVQEHENTPYNKQFDYHFGFIEYILLRFSECMNPVFYNLGSTKMRTHTSRFINELLGRPSRSRRKSTTLSYDSSMSEISRKG